MLSLPNIWTPRQCLWLPGMSLANPLGSLGVCADCCGAAPDSCGCITGTFPLSIEIELDLNNTGEVTCNFAGLGGYCIGGGYTWDELNGIYQLDNDGAGVSVCDDECGWSQSDVAWPTTICINNFGSSFCNVGYIRVCMSTDGETVTFVVTILAAAITTSSGLTLTGAVESPVDCGFANLQIVSDATYGDVYITAVSE